MNKRVVSSIFTFFLTALTSIFAQQKNITLEDTSKIDLSNYNIYYIP